MKLNWEEIQKVLGHIKSNFEWVASWIDGPSQDSAELGLSFHSRQLELSVRRFKQLINPAWPAEDPEKIIFRSYHANQILFQMDLGDQMAFVACHNVCTYFHPSHSSELIGIWPSGLKDQESYTSNENLLWSENGCVKSIPDSCVDYLDIAIINVSTVTGVDMSEIQSEASTRKKVELKENHYRAYKYIEDNQPVVASAIAKFCKIKETTFRKHWLPELRKSGVSSSPDGYVIEDTDFIF